MHVRKALPRPTPRQSNRGRIGHITTGKPTLPRRHRRGSTPTLLLLLRRTRTRTRTRTRRSVRRRRTLSGTRTTATAHAKQVPVLVHAQPPLAIHAGLELHQRVVRREQPPREAHRGAQGRRVDVEERRRVGGPLRARRQSGALPPRVVQRHRGGFQGAKHGVAVAQAGGGVVHRHHQRVGVLVVRRVDLRVRGQGTREGLLHHAGGALLVPPPVVELPQEGVRVALAFALQLLGGNLVVCALQQRLHGPEQLRARHHVLGQWCERGQLGGGSATVRGRQRGLAWHALRCTYERGNRRWETNNTYARTPHTHTGWSSHWHGSASTARHNNSSAPTSPHAHTRTAHTARRPTQGRTTQSRV